MLEEHQEELNQEREKFLKWSEEADRLANQHDDDQLEITIVGRDSIALCLQLNDFLLFIGHSDSPSSSGIPLPPRSRAVITCSHTRRAMTARFAL